MSVADRCSTALQAAAPVAALLGAALPTAAADAMPLRHAGALAVSCTIDRLPAAAASGLCARVAKAARRGAPFPVELAPASKDVLSLVVGGSLRDGGLTLAARLLRPGQPLATAIGGPPTAPVSIRDEAAVRAAIDAALAPILPWQTARSARVPRAPRAE